MIPESPTIDRTAILVDEDNGNTFVIHAFTISGELEPHHCYLIKIFKNGSSKTLYRFELREDRSVKTIVLLTPEDSQALNYIPAFGHIIRSFWIGAAFVFNP